jgi:hypothetical protein
LLSVLPSLLCPLQFLLASARSLRRKANKWSEAMSMNHSSTPHCCILLPSAVPELTWSHPCRRLLQTTVVSSQMKARFDPAALSISRWGDEAATIGNCESLKAWSCKVSSIWFHGHVSIAHGHTKPAQRDAPHSALRHCVLHHCQLTQKVDPQGDTDATTHRCLRWWRMGARCCLLPALPRMLKLSSCCLQLPLPSLAPSLWLIEPAAVQLSGHMQHFAWGADQNNWDRHRR